MLPAFCAIKDAIDIVGFFPPALPPGFLFHPVPAPAPAVLPPGRGRFGLRVVVDEEEDSDSRPCRPPPREEELDEEEPDDDEDDGPPRLVPASEPPGRSRPRSRGSRAENEDELGAALEAAPEDDSAAAFSAFFFSFARWSFARVELPEGTEETAWAEEEDDDADDREEDDAPAEALPDTPCAGDRSWRLSEKRGFLVGRLTSSSLLLSRRSIGSGKEASPPSTQGRETPAVHEEGGKGPCDFQDFRQLVPNPFPK